MLKFTEIYYDDAERFALYLAAKNNEEIELVYEDSYGFPQPPKGVMLEDKVNCLKVGDVEIAYLQKRKSKFENWKRRNRSLYRYMFGQKFKDARERMGMTVEDLADKSGLKPANIRNIELGRYGADTEILGNLLESMGCHIEIVKD